MAAAADQDVLALLQTIDRRSKENAFGLPEREETEPTWEAVSFRLGGINLLVATDQVTELLSLPPLTVVPAAKAWAKGVANIRGTLVPVTDLGGFLDLQPVRMERGARVLVVRAGAMVAGLLVDEVLGIKHLREEERSAKSIQVGERAEKFLRGAYQHEGKLWGVFDVHDLLNSAQFMQVAL